MTHPALLSWPVQISCDTGVNNFGGMPAYILAGGIGEGEERSKLFVDTRTKLTLVLKVDTIVPKLTLLPNVDTCTTVDTYTNVDTCIKVDTCTKC